MPVYASPPDSANGDTRIGNQEQRWERKQFRRRTDGGRRDENKKEKTRDMVGPRRKGEGTDAKAGTEEPGGGPGCERETGWLRCQGPRR